MCHEGVSVQVHDATKVYDCRLFDKKTRITISFKKVSSSLRLASEHHRCLFGDLSPSRLRGGGGVESVTKPTEHPPYRN